MAPFLAFNSYCRLFGVRKVRIVFFFLRVGQGVLALRAKGNCNHRG